MRWRLVWPIRVGSRAAWVQSETLTSLPQDGSTGPTDSWFRPLGAASLSYFKHGSLCLGSRPGPAPPPPPRPSLKLCEFTCCSALTLSGLYTASSQLASNLLKSVETVFLGGPFALASGSPTGTSQLTGSCRTLRHSAGSGAPGWDVQGRLLCQAGSRDRASGHSISRQEWPGQASP